VTQRYQWRVFGLVWPIDPELAPRRHARLRRFFPASAPCGLGALVSLIVYVAHCAG
jgi:hypothetical protein